MLLSEDLLLTLGALGIFVSPIYLYLRAKMTKSNKPHEYSKKFIFRVVGMHFLLMFSITVIHVVILQALLTGNQLLNQRAIFVVSLQVLFLAAALYGSGIYVTAILFETFVTKRYLVIRFLHGPLSHTIIFGAYLGAFANLSFITTALQIHTSVSYSTIFLVLGVFGGIVVAIDNLANGILLLSLLSSIGGLILFWILNTQSNSFSTFFLGLESGFLTTALALLMTKLLKGEKLSWYEPVNIFGK